MCVNSSKPPKCPCPLVQMSTLVDTETTRKIGVEMMDLRLFVCKHYEIIVPLHCQREKAEFAA